MNNPDNKNKNDKNNNNKPLIRAFRTDGYKINPDGISKSKLPPGKFLFFIEANNVIEAKNVVIKNDNGKQSGDYLERPKK